MAALRVAEKNRRVAAVLFHVDSPGGDALASDLIWREVERIRARKPVVVLMGNAAASGGYYVSAAANHIVARKGTMTGSIGVLSIRPVAGGLYGMLGVHPATVQRGARAGLMDLSRRPTEDEMGVLRNQVAFMYDQFKERVSRGRGIETAELEGIAAGRVWTGAEALDLGLVDEVGGFREALRKARELGKIEGDALRDRWSRSLLPEAAVPRRGSPPRRGRGDDRADQGRPCSTLCSGSVWAAAPYDVGED